MNPDSSASLKRSSCAGNWPPGKITSPMNFMNRMSFIVMLTPRSRKLFNGWAKIVCNSMRPSSGRMS
ncbi:Uncharacterised protein [Mycobacterium tuberculosis]|nr:Uncharacterised protein [Mycobacterium tuberculosis]